MTGPRIVCDSSILAAGEALSQLGFDQVTMLPEQEIRAENLMAADALLVRSTVRVDERLLARTPVRFVGTATVGEDHVDRNYLKRAEIDFVSAAGSSAVSVAQFTMALMSILAAKAGRPLLECSLGVIGCGAIGSRVAQAAERLGMKVLRFDPPLQESTESDRYVEMERVSECDLVSLHVPLVSEGPHATRNLVNDAFLARLPEGSLLVNTARGEVIDPEFAIAARRSGRLAGMALDVFPGEPGFHAGLVAHSDFATPHVAGRSLDGMLANTEFVLRSLAAHHGIEWQRPEALTAPAPEEVEIEPENSVVAFLHQSWGLFALDMAMKEAAELEDEERAQAFRRMRRPPYRRDLSSMQVHGRPGPALRAFLDALPRR